jgi:hypothetical protein
MASHIRRIVSNTRERILSTDANNATALHHRALVEASAAILLGDASIFGVIRGLTVSTSGGVLTVTVAPGLALRSGTAATTYDSATQWIELRSSQTLDLAANVDGANPRWVVIEIAEASAVESSEARDIFDPLTGTFSSSSITKVSGSSPTLTARAGTAAAAPVFPAGIAGVIPLGYVYLTAAAASINVSDIVMCRPMLRSENAETFAGAGGRSVWGGGVSVSAAGVDVVLRSAGGAFLNHRMAWSAAPADGTTTMTVTAAGCDGAAFPVADDVVYFYACPPPYPAGYDASLAPREHRPGATALTRYQGLVCADLHNAVVVASTVEPQIDTTLGNPTAGNFAVTCAPFATGAAVNIERTTSMYLGAVSWDQSATDYLVQDVRGSIVTPADETTTTNIATGGLAVYNIWGVGGTLTLFPVTALHVHMQVSLSDNDTSDTTGVTLSVTDRTGVTWRWQGPRANVAGTWTSGYFAILSPSTAGDVTVTVITVEPFDSVYLRGAAYADTILASR